MPEVIDPNSEKFKKAHNALESMAGVLADFAYDADDAETNDNVEKWYDAIADFMGLEKEESEKSA